MFNLVEQLVWGLCNDEMYDMVETCFGCGYCKQACPTGAIKVRQTMPLRESLHEYFLKERGLDLVVDD